MAAHWVEELILTCWIHENAQVAYVMDQAPWHTADALLEHTTLALNYDWQSGRRVREVHFCTPQGDSCHLSFSRPWLSYLKV